MSTVSEPPSYTYMIGQARDCEVEAARTQLAGVIEELEGAKGQTEGLLRRVRVLEGQERVSASVGCIFGCFARVDRPLHHSGLLGGLADCRYIAHKHPSYVHQPNATGPPSAVGGGLGGAGPGAGRRGAFELN